MASAPALPPKPQWNWTDDSLRWMTDKLKQWRSLKLVVVFAHAAFLRVGTSFRIDQVMNSRQAQVLFGQHWLNNLKKSIEVSIGLDRKSCQRPQDKARKTKCMGQCHIDKDRSGQTSSLIIKGAEYSTERLHGGRYSCGISTVGSCTIPDHGNPSARSVNGCQRVRRPG